MSRETTNKYDVLIVGGGVIGLSLAWELAQHDAKVCVIDRGQLGKEASWAGAGMIPPGAHRSCWQNATPLEQLEGYSQALQAEWHQRLLDQTGIDNEYRRCGAVQLAFTGTDADTLSHKSQRWQALGISCHELDPATLADLEPALAAQAAKVTHAVHLPTETQIRNPRHLQALIAACQNAGVDLRSDAELLEFRTSESRVAQATTATGPIEADHFCLTAGSWSGQLAASLGIELPVQPIRGQIVLLQGPTGLLKRNILVGPRYIVSRNDGRLLVGSTQEDAGFENTSTESGVAELMRFAKSISPTIAELPIETQWAGLRPGTLDGLPYLGQLPNFENTWIATGHFRAGLQLSPATAVVMRSLILGQQPPVNITSLTVRREHNT